VPHLIIFLSLFLCALVVSCMLTACQPLVRPFQPEEKTGEDALFRIRDAGGIVLRNLNGLPEGTEAPMERTLLKGLERLEIPATTAAASAPNRRSLFLDATVRTAPLSNARLAVEIDWTLTDVEGHVVGEHRVNGEVQRALWGRPGVVPYATLAERSLPGIAALVQDPAAVAVAAEPDRRRLFVWPVSGAPGNGGPALSRAMDNALRAARLPVITEMEENALVIAGSVHLFPAGNKRQRVEIVWTVLEAGGREIAKLAQANVVEEGSLNGDWGPLPRLIADAAVPGVVDMLRQLPARAEARGTPSGG
jgi:hypothetical protein